MTRSGGWNGPCIGWSSPFELKWFATTCVNVPPGASGFSHSGASSFVPAGGAVHFSGGVTFPPS